MNIGTATPGEEELKAVPHYFINHLSVTQDYSAGKFAKEALALIDEIFKTKRVIVLTGGSGLFIRAILKGLDEFPEVRKEAVEEVRLLYQSGGVSALAELLKIKDPDYYKTVDLQNAYRMIRALEVTLSGRQPYSFYRKQNQQTRKFTPVKIGLELERQALYRRIDARVDRMVQEGLLDEVRSLIAYEHRNPLQTVGYKELFQFLHGEITLDVAVQKIKQHSRNYAKRQITWFRNEQDITWFHPDSIEAMLAFLNKKMTNG